jgi:tripartite-type tricarboxylate transporter receptor subunit TctC
MASLSTHAASIVAGAIAGATLFVAVDAAAQKADFSGKRIEVIIPFAPGGGSDVYMRAIAPHLERHLPGKPTLILRNVPGSRSIPGANQFQDRAKPDGTHLMVVSATTVASFVFSRDKVKFEMDKWEPVLLSPQGMVGYAHPSLGMKSWKDLAQFQKRMASSNLSLTFGGQSANSGELRFIMMLHLLGLKTNHVWGLNRGPVRLAFERGEFSINYDSMPGYMGGAIQLVKAGKAVPLFTAGIIDEKGQMARDPNAMDLPHFAEVMELVHGKKPSGPGWDAWMSSSKMNTMMNKGMFLPAGTPKYIVDAWTKAVSDMLKDPVFDKEASSVIEGYPQYIGDKARPIIKDSLTFTPESWQWLKDYFKKEHNVTLN